MTDWNIFFTGCVGWVQTHYADLLYFAIVLLLTFLVALIVHSCLLKCLLRTWVEKTSGKLDDLLLDAMERPLLGFVLVVGIWIGVKPLLNASPEMVRDWGGRIFPALLCGMVLWGFLRSVNVVTHLLRQLLKLVDTEMDELCLSLIDRTLRLCVVLAGCFFIGQNIFNWNVSALLTGAGVLGLAVALASKDAISNLFGSVMLALDKPFTVGDRIKSLPNIDGTVERVGFRSTTLRGVSGHLFSVPNNKLADAVIENFSRGENRRHDLMVNLTNPQAGNTERLEALVRELLENQPFRVPELPPVMHISSLSGGQYSLTFGIYFRTREIGRMQEFLEKFTRDFFQRATEEGISIVIPSIEDHR